MSEYWVSQAKYHCKICNCWIADNRVNRQNHDNSVKHKSLLDQQQKKKREEKLYGLRNEEDLKRQLAEIEKAASAAIQEDRQQVGAMFASSSGIVRSSHVPSNNLVYHGPKGKESSEAVAIDKGTRNESNGFYVVRGQGYLEGELNENLLVKDATCQIFIEELDDWMDAVIVGRREIPVPHTELTLKTFTVDHKSKDGWKREEGIKSDKIRLLATLEGEPTELDGTLLSAEKAGNTSVAVRPQPKPKIEQSTGMSGWQTVSVEIIDQEEVEKQRLLEEIRITAELNAIKEKERLEMIKDLEANSMSRIRTYKGFDLGGPVLIDAGRDIDLSGGEVIAFKKRKLGDQSTSDDIPVDSCKPSIKVSKIKENIRKRVSDDDDDS